MAARFQLSDPVGCEDIADRLGVRRQTVHQWRYRNVMPLPLFMVSDTPVWDWPTVEAWARESGRLGRAARPAAPARARVVADRYPVGVLSGGNW